MLVEMVLIASLIIPQQQRLMQLLIRKIRRMNKSSLKQSAIAIIKIASILINVPINTQNTSINHGNFHVNNQKQYRD